MYSSLEISILVHATEDENKIVEKILEYLKRNYETVKIESVNMEGHWKNPIVLVKISIFNNVDELYYDLKNKLVEIHGENEINDYFIKHVDNKGYLYIRLDKQKFFLGNIFLADTDSIRLIFKVKGKFEP